MNQDEPAWKTLVIWMIELLGTIIGFTLLMWWAMILLSKILWGNL